MIMYCFHNNSPINFTIIEDLQMIDLKFAFRSMIDRSSFDRSDRSFSRIVWPLPSNHPWAWVCVLHTKRLEEMAYNLACWCIQMAYTQHSWMLMDIVVGLSVRPSVRLFVYSIFRWLCICWQITWNKWHKIWHDVVIIGRWLLPSLVDTGDICCHYWQLILVDNMAALV